MAFSQNGFPAIKSYGDERLLGNPLVPGSDVKVLGGVLRTAAPVLLWVAAMFHRTVEPLVQDQGIWGYEPRNIIGSTVLSNHASGTAIDLNSALHPLGASGTFSATQVRGLRAILEKCEGYIRWGGDYSGRKDEMHFEVNCSLAEIVSLGGRLTHEPPPPQPPPPPDEVFEDMDAQTFKQLVRDGVKWALEDPAIDPIIIQGVVQRELAKMLNGPADFQAFKQAVHDGTAWALEDPAVDVSRFPKA